MTVNSIDLLEWYPCRDVVYDYPPAEEEVGAHGFWTVPEAVLGPLFLLRLYLPLDLHFLFRHAGLVADTVNGTMRERLFRQSESQ